MKTKTILVLLATAAFLSMGRVASAQERWAIKTNLVHDATASINLAGEYAFAPRWSVELGASANFWPIKERHWQHAIIEPEIRYWTCEKFGGWFFALNLVGGYVDYGNFKRLGARVDDGSIASDSPFYDVANLLGNHYYKGGVIGGGIGVGYAAVLGRHWNLEFEIAPGFAYTFGTEYYWPGNDRTQTPVRYTYGVDDPTKFVNVGSSQDAYYSPGIGWPVFTKLAISIVYLF